ncbi:hypothetical protein SGHV041 [Glossina pallidipes salivary gland hypertrophy virus]|uniref:Uncharacterized protein n=1 Tax=Glossina hytrovirus (isolate Glossina pallidipes/Ethiopia/Seibersdorf/-) TaxID=379529 RepID=B0YLJ5_GHVS|nr:hypothetical protein SGHV041 [Glossina pallidipes salivary gland hypertrophy virus]ABQ08814.1 hypothetical protein SGHV041 [Glossina pallidipes salivary gland hypertrophy virus]
MEDDSLELNQVLCNIFNTKNSYQDIWELDKIKSVTQKKFLSDVDEKITFKPFYHEYIVNDKKCDKSVSQFIKDELFDDFDANAVAFNSAKRKLGKDVTRFKSICHVVNDRLRWMESAWFGSIVHYLLELYFTHFFICSKEHDEQDQRFPITKSILIQFKPDNIELNKFLLLVFYHLCFGEPYNLLLNLNKVERVLNSKTNLVELILKNNRFNYELAIDKILKSIDEDVESVGNVNAVKNNILANSKPDNLLYDMIKESMDAFIGQFSPIIFKLLKNPRCEYIVYDEERSMAGTIDLVDVEEKYCKETNTIVKYLTLYDWKTNIKLLPVSNKSQMYFINKIKNEKSPFCNKFLSKMEQYFCQLHTYANILERCYNNCIVRNMYLINIQPINTALISVPNHKECSCFHINPLKNK